MVVGVKTFLNAAVRSERGRGGGSKVEATVPVGKILGAVAGGGVGGGRYARCKRRRGMVERRAGKFGVGYGLGERAGLCGRVSRYGD